MKTGKCPKCNSRDIYKKSTYSQRSNLSVSTFKQARLEDYVCTKCGYIETYVLKEDDLKKIRDKWKRVSY
jgi:predicted nucleic-acid-binding Zn-ribbon protein